MTHAVVTIEVDSKTPFDLALPLNIPSRVLAEAIAQALEVDKEGKQQYSLAVKTEQGVVRIPAQSTLGDASVLDGFRLQLFPEKSAPPRRSVKSQAYLETETGQTFPLDADSLMVGRKDLKRGVLVDIDLTSLDYRKIVSRKHAQLKRENEEWFITDQGSANGTWLNGHPLTPHRSYPLQNDDEVMFGRNGVMVRFVENK